MKKQFLNWIPVLLLLVVSALIYLPFIQKIGLINDDWYLIFAGKAGGARFFSTVFSSDRPMRAFVMGPAYFLFGDNILLYHLSGYLFRFLSGVCAYWLFQMIWPKNKSANTWLAILFVIYPGFLSQVNPIDYQSQLFSLFLAVLSIALTIKAILVSGWTKILLILLAIVTGIFYLGLVEYFFGFELLRVICVFLLNKNTKSSFIQTSLTSLKQWLPSSIIPIGFFFWRVFLFDSERKATDIGAQLQTINSNPLLNSFWLGLALFEDTFRAAFLAWSVPLYQLNVDLRVRDHILSFGIAALIFMLIVWGSKHLDNAKETGIKAEMEDHSWQALSIAAGFGFVVLSLLPVTFVNRRLLFEVYSRYALAASLGSAMLLAGLLFSISNKKIRYSALAFLIIVATLTHFHNGARAAAQTDSFRDFWWQVSWRIPGFQPETTLVANYPITAIEEDYFVWGPANLIYNQSPATEGGIIKPTVDAVVLNEKNLLAIMQDGGIQSIERRGILTQPDLGRVLVLSQPTQFSCVHVMDGNYPIISTYEEAEIASVANYSKIDLIDVNAEAHTPPSSIFGAEPEHGWCYYFQQASLAGQRGDWETASQLGSDAWDQGLRPDDKSEWLIFLKAYARLNQFDRVTFIAKDIKKDAFQNYQICQSLASKFGNSDTSPEMQQLLKTIYCSK